MAAKVVNSFARRRFQGRYALLSGKLILSGFPSIWRRWLTLMPRTKQDEPNTHRTMQVVNHIRSLIENGTLQPGDKIPPEREFCAHAQDQPGQSSNRHWLHGRHGSDEGPAWRGNLCGRWSAGVRQGVAWPDGRVARLSDMADV